MTGLLREFRHFDQDHGTFASYLLASREGRKPDGRGCEEGCTEGRTEDRGQLPIEAIDPRGEASNEHEAGNDPHDEQGIRGRQRTTNTPFGSLAADLIRHGSRS
jgi:hypothetical protein